MTPKNYFELDPDERIITLLDELANNTDEHNISLVYGEVPGDPARPVTYYLRVVDKTVEPNQVTYYQLKGKIPPDTGI